MKSEFYKFAGMMIVLGPKQAEPFVKSGFVRLATQDEITEVNDRWMASNAQERERINRAAEWFLNGLKQG